MARALRIEFAGAFYHILNRGLERRDIFKNSEDYEDFLHIIEDMYHKYQLTIYAYCLLPNHYHLFLETPRGQLSSIMKHINGVYAQHFNKKYNRAGGLFQGRYKAILVEKDSYSLELSRYIHLNPVKARLVPDPQKWAWSSYPVFLNHKKYAQGYLQTNWLLSQFGETTETAQQNFKKFTMEGLKEEWDPLKKLKKGCILGTDSFVSLIQEKFLQNKSDPEVPHLKEFKKHLSVSEITSVVESLAKQKPLGKTSIKRKLLIYALKKFSGLTLKEIGENLDGWKYSRVSLAAKRIQKQAQKNHSLQILLKRLEERLEEKCKM